jgi:hypothetical protein
VTNVFLTFSLLLIFRQNKLDRWSLKKILVRVEMVI